MLLALKELVFAQTPGARDVDAFEREGALLAQLQHPRIPRFVRYFREGAGPQLRLYLAQEFVGGTSLLAELETHHFSEAEARHIAREVLEILEYLHDRSPRIIHRDVKPANLIRRPDGAIVLVDFGAARVLERASTHGATMVGSFGYSPIEQLGGTIDESSDLYALGATLIHLLSGKPPDELLGVDLKLRIRGVVHAPGLEHFLRRLTALRPRDRIRTASQARRILDAPRPRFASPWVWTSPLWVAALVGIFTATAPHRAQSPRPTPPMSVEPEDPRRVDLTPFRRPPSDPPLATPAPPTGADEKWVPPIPPFRAGPRLSRGSAAAVSFRSDLWVVVPHSLRMVDAYGMCQFYPSLQLKEIRYTPLRSFGGAWADVGITASLTRDRFCGPEASGHKSLPITLMDPTGQSYPVTYSTESGSWQTPPVLHTDTIRVPGDLRTFRVHVGTAREAWFAADIDTVTRTVTRVLDAP